MPNLSDTIARLSQLRRMGAGGDDPFGVGRLVELAAFGSNPGNLRAKAHLPAGLAVQPALVVVLHGCTQSADGYDLGSGWSQVADRHDFALLFPEQQQQNNANLCFNWFSPQDNRRDLGEALSIRQMIGAMVARHGIDPARIYVTGLSAGGAMASVMLATYPETFAGGAIIAGLPYGCAQTIPQAFDRMRGHGGPTGTELAALVRGASDHAGPWPVVSIWHGSEDATVSPANANAIVAQWRGLHRVGAVPSRTETVQGYPRRTWCDATGRAVIEEYSITGMGHGTPLDTLSGDGCGKSAPFMLQASISSTHRICRFWGLLDARDAMPERHDPIHAAPRELVPADAGVIPPPHVFAKRPAIATKGAAGGVGKVIEDALKAAGLMR